MHKPEVEDLQFHIHQIKKQNLDLQNENQLLKVKIRKLNEEINKKNKQLDAILDPQKGSNVIKILSRHGASLIMRLKDENFTLQRKLAEKEQLAKKLHSELQTTQLYITGKAKLTSPSLKLYESQEIVEKIENLNGGSTFRATTDMTKIKQRSKSVCSSSKRMRSRSISPTTKKKETDSIDLQRSYMIMINNNLQKIKQCGIQGDKSNRSCNSVLTNKSDTPHEEIQQLQTYLLNVLNEVDSLKSTISKLQAEQTKTTMVLNNKNNIKKLVSEIEGLKLNHAQKNSKKRTRPPSTEISSIESSKSGSSVYTESDYNETTEESMTDNKPAQKKHQETEKIKKSPKSVGIQTRGLFCTRTFTPKKSNERACLNNENIGREDCDLEIEYIN